MATRCTLGLDIGTSSSKGVLVDYSSGRTVASATVAHSVERPRAGHVEMDGGIWWDEFVELSRQLLTDPRDVGIVAVGVSGMGSCVLLADLTGEPVRPAALYGVDTRATAQIRRMTAELGVDEVSRVGGLTLTTQAAGPKIVWVCEEEPEAYARARQFFMPASWRAFRLTGNYVLDHQSASQCSPLHDVERGAWHESWWDRFARGIERPELLWAGDIARKVTENADIRRIVAVGGGTQRRFWLQLVSDMAGLIQEVSRTTVGASSGAAFLAACALAEADTIRIENWNPVAEAIIPDTRTTASHDELFALYLCLYAGTKDVAHALAARQQ